MSRKRKGNWRLPKKEELLALTDCTKSYPASIDSEINSGNYWSSTTYASNASYACVVFFYDGYTGYYVKTGTYDVRCVKDTENGLEWSEASLTIMTWEEAVEYAENMNKERT